MFVGLEDVRDLGYRKVMHVPVMNTQRSSNSNKA